jgi:hypothetical protein
MFIYFNKYFKNYDKEMFIHGTMFFEKKNIEMKQKNKKNKNKTHFFRQRKEQNTCRIGPSPPAQMLHAVAICSIGPKIRGLIQIGFQDQLPILIDEMFFPCWVQ